MLIKKVLKKAFTKICNDEYTLEVALDAYDDYLKRKAEEKGLVPGTDEYSIFFANDKAETLPWLVEGIATDKVLDYINSHMDYVPIIEYTEDEYLQDIIQGIKATEKFFKFEHGQKVNMMPYLFNKRACRVGSTDFDSMGNVCGLNYITGEFVTYILEDGNVVMVEENSFSFDELDSDSKCTFRRIVDNESWMLDELDDLFEPDYQGLFDI